MTLLKVLTRRSLRRVTTTLAAAGGAHDTTVAYAPVSQEVVAR